LLAAEAVEKAFGPSRALRGGRLHIVTGELVAIMGPSGSGKTTLLHCLAGILQPDAGAVIYAGRRIDHLGDAERSRLRRTEFGFVFQFGQLVGELTALENVALPLLLNGSRRRAAMAEARAWLDTFGLSSLAGRRPGELSGGESQRVAVARALVTGPRIIFADEPTGSLDTAAGAVVLKTLTAAARQRDVAVVLVTHDADVGSYADRIVRVRDGLVGVTDEAAAMPSPQEVRS
jgi:putative ABC transport system ATP-binding protein